MKNGFLIQQPARKDWAPYFYFQDAFSPEDCEHLIKLSEIYPAQPATIGAEGKVDWGVRSSEIHWLPRSRFTEWAFEKLGALAVAARDQWCGFNLSGIPYDLQLTRYKATELGHYGMHQDFGPGEQNSRRKLAIVVLLNDGFQGGGLELMDINGPDQVIPAHIMRRGTAICFPAWSFHRVHRVTAGERWSLVAWVHGSPFV